MRNVQDEDCGVYLPPVVQHSAQLSLFLLQLRQPLPAVLIAALNIVHVLVGQHNVENREDEKEGAYECLRLQPPRLEERHHADLVGDNHDEG